MAEVFIFHVSDDRTLDFRQTEPIMLEDNNVTEFMFRIPKTLNELDVTSWAWWFVYKNANGDKYSSPLLLTDDADEPDLYSNATYVVDYGFTQKAGRVKVALEALNVGTGDAPTNEWHTKTYIIDVNDTLQGNQIEFKPSEVDIISGMLQSTLNQIREMIETGGGGGTSDDIENKSTVSGSTVTDALTSLSDEITTKDTITVLTTENIGNNTTLEDAVYALTDANTVKVFALFSTSIGTTLNVPVGYQYCIIVCYKYLENQHAYVATYPISTDASIRPRYCKRVNGSWSNWYRIPTDTLATTSANGLMSSTDKGRLDTLYADYSSAITALGV